MPTAARAYHTQSRITRAHLHSRAHTDHHHHPPAPTLVLVTDDLPRPCLVWQLVQVEPPGGGSVWQLARIMDVTLGATPVYECKLVAP